MEAGDKCHASKTHNNYNLELTGKVTESEMIWNLVESAYAAQPSSAEGPYKAGTVASFNRK